MLKTLALGHVALAVTDLERSVAYYQDILGLKTVDRTSAGTYLASLSGTEAIVLRQSGVTSCQGFRLQIDPSADLKQVQRKLECHGIKGDFRTDPHPHISESVVFLDMNGFEVELTGERRHGAPTAGVSVAPLRLGHISLFVTDVKRTCEFYGSLLGFRASDWIEDYLVFMRCGPEHHTLNFLQAPKPSMHHVAFEVRDTAHLNASCDHLALAGVGVVWGPVRHGPGHNVATYHRNADSQLVELFTEMDYIANEELGYFDPRPWHGDQPQRPKVWSSTKPRDVWGAPVPPGFFAVGS